MANTNEAPRSSDRLYGYSQEKLALAAWYKAVGLLLNDPSNELVNNLGPLEEVPERMNDITSTEIFRNKYEAEHKKLQTGYLLSRAGLFGNLTRHNPGILRQALEVDAERKLHIKQDVLESLMEDPATHAIAQKIVHLEGHLVGVKTATKYDRYQESGVKPAIATEPIHVPVVEVAPEVSPVAIAEVASETITVPVVEIAADPASPPVVESPASNRTVERPVAKRYSSQLPVHEFTRDALANLDDQSIRLFWERLTMKAYRRNYWLGEIASAFDPSDTLGEWEMLFRHGINLLVSPFKWLFKRRKPDQDDPRENSLPHGAGSLAATTH